MTTRDELPPILWPPPVEQDERAEIEKYADGVTLGGRGLCFPVDRPELPGPTRVRPDWVRLILWLLVLVVLGIAAIVAVFLWSLARVNGAGMVGRLLLVAAVLAFVSRRMAKGSSRG